MLIRLAPFVACAALLPACGPAETGDLTVRWGVGLTGTCTGASLRHVVTELESSYGVVERRDEPCEAGFTRFLDVPVGTYRVHLVGYDEGDIPAYEATVNGVEVREDVASPLIVGRLAPRSGEIALAWYFESGRLCSAYDVDTVTIHLFADDTEVVRRDVACDVGETVIGELQTAAYDVRLDAIDRSGDTSHSYTLAGLKLRPGHHVDLEAALAECDDGRCY
ncbi:MAG: hypothetical protein HY905_16315 [Deltaproteobacteria bacterium]|nr:hypothetical protein [Deltaproteobacteria bacterium]